MNHVHYPLTIHFMENEPVAAARKLETFEPEISALIIKEAPISPAINVLKSMIPNIAAKLFPYFSDDQQLKLFTTMEIADLASILRHVEMVTREAALSHLSVRKQTFCKMLINYPEYTLGSAIETDVLVVDSQMEVKEVIDRIKKRSNSYLQFIYVINEHRNLEGQIYIGDVLQAKLNTIIKTLIKDKPQPLSASTDVTSVIDRDIWHQTDVFAVKNKKQEFIGIVHHHRLRHIVSLKQASNSQRGSESTELLEVYGDTIVTMVNLIQPFESKV